MLIFALYKNIINLGVKQFQTLTFIDKLKTKNHLALICIIFSSSYLAHFAITEKYICLLAITIGMLLFISSLLLNYYSYYTTSSIIIIFSTNLCVLFFSSYYGAASGFHFYLFTSPLIVLTIIEKWDFKLFSILMSTYLFTYILLQYSPNFTNNIQTLSTNDNALFYNLNFIFTFIILSILSFNLLRNNNRVHDLLIKKNFQLVENQIVLESEINDRMEAENKTIQALTQREVLLSEVHHRVKNNLAVISGLLELQCTNVSDDFFIRALKASQNRIKTIAILHEKLYETKSFSEVNINDYFNNIIDHISIIYDVKRTVKIVLNAESIILQHNQALHLGLLLNELVTNSIKHAFVNIEFAEINISFKEDKTTFNLLYSDNGTGFKRGTNNESSLGLTLIEIFSQQINGNYEYLEVESGTTFKLSFTN